LLLPGLVNICAGIFVLLLLSWAGARSAFGVLRIFRSLRAAPAEGTPLSCFPILADSQQKDVFF
jgi:hypothetical protein